MRFITFIATSLCLFLLALIGISNQQLLGQTVIGGDDFDGGGGGYVSRVFSVDNSDRNGAYENSRFDVFGIINRASTNNSFKDDSLSIFAGDTFGVIPEAKTDSLLGIQDVIFDDGSASPGTERTNPVNLTYTFDVTGQTDLALFFDVAAMGNFEGPNNSSGDPTNADTLTLEASFDGGSKSLIASGTGIDDEQLDYTLEGGAVNTLDDPFQINGAVLNNVFQQLTFPIAGSGTELKLEFTWKQNGSQEVLAFDNFAIVTGFSVPENEGDFDLDGDVDIDDLDRYIGNLDQPAVGSLADLDLTQDGQISFEDFEIHFSQLVETSNGGKGTFQGDLNLDGVVDSVDEATLLSNEGQAVTSWAQGDVNGDGFVDVLNDRFVLLANLGLDNGGDGTAVPEPGSLTAMLMLSVVAAARRRR